MNGVAAMPEPVIDPKDTDALDAVSEIAHLLTGFYAANCCHRTGGRDPSAKHCMCRILATRAVAAANS